MSERWRPTFAEINLTNLTLNYKTLKSCVPDSQMICPMVKADAYGHGDTEVALHLEGLKPDGFGVVLVEEGVKLRGAGIQTPILVFGTFDSFSAEACVNFNLTPVLSSWEQLKTFERVLDENADFQIQLKFNTGMARLGFEPADSQALSQYFDSQHRFRLRGLCTHLLNGEDAGLTSGHTESQIRKFNELIKKFPVQESGLQLHYLNSSAILMRYSQNIGMRPGIALYGAYPPTHQPPKVTLYPVMGVKSELALVRKVPAGATVSYGATWKASRDSTIGLVPIGYADGYSRAFSNKGVMLFRGRRVPVVGIVCMDYTMIDLTDVAREALPHAGEEVVILGRQENETLTAEEVAAQIQTIPYEITTRLGARVPRVFVH